MRGAVIEEDEEEDVRQEKGAQEKFPSAREANTNVEEETKQNPGEKSEPDQEKGQVEGKRSRLRRLSHSQAGESDDANANMHTKATSSLACALVEGGLRPDFLTVKERKGM